MSSATCQARDPPSHIVKSDIHRQHPFIAGKRRIKLALLFSRPAEPVQEADLLLVTGAQTLYGAAEDGLGDWELLLVEERGAQRFRGAQPSFGGPQRFLEFGN